MPGYPAIAPAGISTALSTKERRKEEKHWGDGREAETMGSLRVSGQLIVFIVSSHLFQIRFAKRALLLNLQEDLISQTFW